MNENSFNAYAMGTSLQPVHNLFAGRDVPLGDGGGDWPWIWVAVRGELGAVPALPTGGSVFPSAASLGSALSMGIVASAVCKFTPRNVCVLDMSSESKWVGTVSNAASA